MESTYRDYTAIRNTIDRKNTLKKAFFEDNRPFLGFKKITEERKKEIEEMAFLWRTMQGITPPGTFL